MSDRPPTTTVGELIGHIVVDRTTPIPDDAFVLDAMVIFHVQHADSTHAHTYWTSSQSIAAEEELGMLTGVLDLLRHKFREQWDSQRQDDD